jgi:hypothetical protein
LLIIGPSDRDTRGVRAEVLSAGSDCHGTGFPPHHPFGANHRRLSRGVTASVHGGTIKRVAVDVSGEAFIDLEREAP